MKKLIAFLLAAILLFSLLPTAFAEKEPVALTQAQEALIAYAEAMYARGERVQYDTVGLVPSASPYKFRRFEYDSMTPEDCTAQYPRYTNCAAFTYNVYLKALGCDITYWTTASQIKVDDATRVWHYDVTGKETDAEKAAVQKAFLELLQPCDIIVNRHTNNTKGHSMFYCGNGKIIHSTGISYEHSARRDHREKNGSIAEMKTSDFFDLTNKRSFFGGDVNQITVLRPLNTWKGEIPAESLNRLKNLRGVMAEKLCSKTVGQSVAPGEELTYTIRLRNDNKTAVTLEVKDAVPVHTVFVSGCDKVEGSALSWTVEIPAEKTQEIAYTVRVENDTKLLDGKTAIVADKATVGGVACRCPSVYVGKHLTDAEKTKLAEAASDASALAGWDRAAEIYKAVGVDLKSLLSAPKDVFASLFQKSQSDAALFALSAASPYFKAVAPTLYGGRTVDKSELYGGVRTRGLLFDHLETGDLVVCTDETGSDAKDASFTVSLVTGDNAVLPLTAGGDLKIRTDVEARRILNTAISCKQFVVLRPALLRDGAAAVVAAQETQTSGVFTDAGAITQECAEAVEILSSFKVVTGFPDGSFKPSDKLTRAQAAKILCCVALGVTGAEAISSSGSTFKDVPPTHWANKYVEYCAAKDVVAGKGAGKFDPDGKLTGLAFGKMLLVALGADPKPLTGAGWDKNVRMQLNSKHLDYGLTVDNKELDRQSACRLSLNALFDGEGKNAESTLAYKVFGVRREQIGLHAEYYRRPVYAYYSSNADAYWPGNRLELTSSPVRVIPTGPVTGGAFVEALGVTKLTADKLDVYRSGLHWNPKTVRDVWQAGSKGYYALSGDGIRLEFYYNARKGVYTVLHIPTFCRKITAVTEPVLNADGSVKTPGSVTFEDLPPLETDAFKASDVGTYGLFRGTAEKDWRRCTKVVEPVHRTVLTGKLTAYEPMVSATIDGKAYRYPYQDLVARGAEKVVFEDDAKTGDTVHAVIDDLGFCYAVWK